jgi:hypothetical protein
MKSQQNYAPPLPLGFGWSSEEEEDNTSSFSQLEPYNNSENVLNSELVNGNSEKLNSQRNNILQLEELVKKNRKADRGIHLK